MSLEAKEELFRSFFRDALSINENYAIVDFYLCNLNGEEILNLFNSLDNNNNNKIILLEQLKALKDDSIYFSLDNINLIDFITTLNTKEIFFCTIYFKNIPLTIWGNYNLSFPVFFKDINDLQTYKTIAEKNNLEISNINIK